MKRRNFLQFSSTLLASLGLSHINFFNQANSYGQVLAQNTPRKLALLVGINNYPVGTRSLQGCLTDVEMQQELLIHRFGFKAADILQVTDANATRKGIITAFENHLMKQAKPGDVVVFHFSGHGSRVIDPMPITQDKLNGTMVPFDTLTNFPNVVRDIMGKTLFLLMSAIPTENLTVVLDSCFSGGSDRGNLVVRSTRLDRGGNLKVNSEELEYQQQLLKQLNLLPEEFNQRRAKGIARGVALTSAQDFQFAADAPFGDFHAGAFTYLLTRYLWQQSRNSSVVKVFDNLKIHTHDLAQSSGLIQEPDYEVKPGSKNESELVYFSESATPSAEGVIRKKISDNQIEFWLGGVASQSLEGFQAGSIFSLIDNQGRSIGQIEQTSRVGLVGYGKPVNGTPLDAIKPGVLLLEEVKGIPTNLTLKIGLDESLGAEKEQALKAIQTIKRVEAVSVAQRGVVNYIIGRVKENDVREFQQQRISNPPPVGAIGLFTAGRVPIANTFGRVGELAGEAIQFRLQNRLKSLLVVQILQTLVTSESASLDIDINIKSLNNATSNSSRANTRTIAFPANTNIQVEIQNNESSNLYISAVLIDSSGNLIVLFPLDWDAPEDAALVPSGKMKVFPELEGNWDIRLLGPSGTLELLVLASVKPIRNALKGLQSIARSQGARRDLPLGLSEDEPVSVMASLLSDFNEISRASAEFVNRAIKAERTITLVDSKQIAVKSTLIEVVG